MSSSDTPSDSITLDANTGTTSLEELLTDIISKAHVRQIGHLLVTRTAGVDDAPDTSNQTRFGFPEDHQCTDVLITPQANASAERHRAFTRQEALRANMITAILDRLKSQFEYVYHDVIDTCGGAKKIFMLSLPRIMTVILREIDNSADARERQLKDLVSAATLDTTQDFPFRHYRTRVTAWTTELTDIGYAHAPSDLLQIIMTCLKPFATDSPPLSAQLDSFAMLPREDRTGPRLLADLVAYERLRQRQGLTILEPTTRSEHYAAQASSSSSGTKPTLARFMAAYNDGALTAMQRTILDKHMEAALDTMAFAAKHPDKPPKMLSNQFCPLHSWQPSHAESSCHALNGTKPAPREKKA
jgi:hypothetical protein